MFSSGFVTHGMYLIAGKKVYRLYQHLTTGKVVNPRWPPKTLKLKNTMNNSVYNCCFMSTLGGKCEKTH